MSRDKVVHHITEVAQRPSFSSYEERLHPYILDIFNGIEGIKEHPVAGNSLIFERSNNPQQPTVALAAHLDKINHYGESYPDELPVSVTKEYIEGAMDDSAGVGLLLTLAEASQKHHWPNLLFFLSEMEESMGLKEHPELLKNSGEGYEHGMGARNIAQNCIQHNRLPDIVVTLDTTPLFKGTPGIALYASHWELTDLEASESLKTATSGIIDRFQSIDGDIQLHNNTNDYLHYGYTFNQKSKQDVVSIAIEPSIYPYHQIGERVFIEDIHRLYDIMVIFLDELPNSPKEG